MARAGRPRRTDVQRTPCGKIVKEDRMRPEPVDDVAAWPRIKELAKKKALDPRLATELGRLLYFEKIRPIEGDAAKEWIATVHSYRRHVTGAQSENPKVASLEIGIGRVNPPEPEHYTKEQREAIKNIEDRYDRAFLAIMDRSDGVRLMKAANALCLEDKVLTYAELQDARRAFMLWARHFGLDKRNKV